MGAEEEQITADAPATMIGSRMPAQTAPKAGEPFKMPDERPKAQTDNQCKTALRKEG